MNTHTLELDLSKDGLGAGLVRVGQGDKHGTTIKALIYDGGAEASLTGFTAYLEVLLPDKRHYYRAVAAISGNAATVTVDENKLCSVAGYTDEAYFAFEKDGVRYSTERFAVEILRCVTEGQQPAQNWDDAIDNLISRGNAAVSAANTAAGAARTATTSANNAASAATSAASAGDDAAGAANTAAQRANNAADRVDSAIADAEKATKSSNEAASKADASASKADIAAADAITAAEDARDATKRALSIIGSGGGGSGTGSGGGASSEELEKVKADNAVLARALAEATDSYIVIDEICYVPSSRAATITEELLSINGASFDGDIETITLV